MYKIVYIDKKWWIGLFVLILIVGHLFFPYRQLTEKDYEEIEKSRRTPVIIFGKDIR